MTVTDTITFQLDACQAAIADCYLRSLAGVMSIMGARGSGKSSICRAVMLMAALRRKQQILYFSQSTSNSNDQFSKMIENDCVKEYLYRGHDQEPWTTKPHPTIRFQDHVGALGSTILFFSLEDHSGKLGYHPGLIFVDEAQSVSETAWSRTIFPMRVRVGKPAPIIVAGSCPQTDDHWSWNLHQRGLVGEDGFKSFTLGIDTALAFKTPSGQEFLRQARSTMAAADFDSEFLLKPGGLGDRYLNGADVDACVQLYDRSKADLNAERGTIMAFDPSLSRQDPQAYLIMDLNGYVMHSHSISKELSDTDQIKEIVETAKKWKALLVVESNATAAVTYVGALRTLVPYGVREVPFRNISTKSGEAKNILFKQMAMMLEKRRPKINPECKTLIHQLKNLRDFKTPGGSISIKCPGRDHDDESACFVIACEALSKGWKPVLQLNNPAMGLI